VFAKIGVEEPCLFRFVSHSRSSQRKVVPGFFDDLPPSCRTRPSGPAGRKVRVHLRP
jgi:hypothetical protein